MAIKSISEQSVKLKQLPTPGLRNQVSGIVAEAADEPSTLQAAANRHNREGSGDGESEDVDLESILGGIKANRGEADAYADADADVGNPTTPYRNKLQTQPEPEPEPEPDSEGRESVDLKDSEDAPLLAVVQIYKMRCLTCSYLVPAATKKFNECHFSAGNKLCPAASLKIIQHIPISKILASFKEAEASGDLSRVSRLYAQVAKRPDWVQQRINDELRKARNRSDW